MDKLINPGRFLPCAVGIIFSVIVAQATYAQAISFPNGAAPVIASPSVTASDSSGRPMTVVDTKNNNKFSAAYDANGRLVSLRSTHNRNAYDLRAVQYLADGRIQRVQFGNLYQIEFSYSQDGTQEIVDSFGSRVIRKSAAGGPLVTQTTSDKTGYLVPSLQLLRQLMINFGKTLGLTDSPV